MEKESIDKIKKEISELENSLLEVLTKEEKEMIREHINSLKKSLREKVLVSKKMLDKEVKVEKEKPIVKKDEKFSEFERTTFKRLYKKDKKIVKKRTGKPSSFVKLSNKFFSSISHRWDDASFFSLMKKDLAKTNMRFLSSTYISVILMTVLISFFVSLFVFIFLMIFKIGMEGPILSLVDNFDVRILQTFWIMLVIPIITFIFVYFYPSMEKRSLETRIDRELPFAVIHMSAISGSMVEPSRIFKIILATKEYPYLEKEFSRLLNEINVLGYDLVTALRNTASGSPSKRLTELFNGFATTISSGGDLSNFFDKRAQSLLFDYRIEKEKQTRASETFMDIYISVVIAAPMILMLVLMMMKIGGLGISLSTSAISLIMVLGVSVINVIFLVFLHLKQPGG